MVDSQLIIGLMEGRVFNCLIFRPLLEFGDKQFFVGGVCSFGS